MAKLIFDIEVYRNYFLVAFKNIAKGTYRYFEIHEDEELADIEDLRKIIRTNTLIGFNAINFDVPVLSAVLHGRTCDEAKQVADAIILNNLRPWQIEQRFGFTLARLDVIDLIEVAPGIASLKIYGGRMHGPKMQDLPIEPDALIAADQCGPLVQYCRNDLDVTEALYRRLEPQIKLREDMGRQYELDLRSKSDAQIAEAVIKSEVEKLSGVRVYPPKPPGQVRYVAPPYIDFLSDELNAMVERVAATPFMVADSGKVLEPDWIKAERITIGQSTYTMGIGGLHSTESCVSHQADDDTLLIDRDVASYYPNIILNLGLEPSQMSGYFSHVYKDIVTRRLAAKAAGDSVTDAVLKIVINGSFGKFGSKYSVLYSPDLLIRTTITGQLMLLMLIEALEDDGIQVVSANTDGIVIKCPRARYDDMLRAIRMWEIETGFKTEETQYKAIYSRDVNNYMAVKTGGGVKAKGVYAQVGLSKTPSNVICLEAVAHYLQDGVPIEDTVHDCWDIRRFVTVRTVRGGALDQMGESIGKAIRWYYSTDPVHAGPIIYKVNNHSVPRTDGAKPLMELPSDDAFPGDVDLDWYVREAKSILSDIGVSHA